MFLGFTGSIILIIACIIAVAVFIGLVVLLIFLLRGNESNGGRESEDGRGWGIETPERRAGRLGERFATEVIGEILNEKDVLFTNVEIESDGKKTELDNLIVNNRGVFIIEVKNYSGSLFGTEEDYNWVQTKMTSSGYFYQNNVKNPIKQVNRQVYILSNFLRQYGADVWIEGYVILLENNSPVEHSCILKTQADIDRVIHNGRNQNLTQAMKEKVVSLLKD